MQTFNLPSQVCRQTFNLPRKFECKLAPPFACKCLRACPRVQICLQTFKTPPRKFSRKLSTPASQKNCRDTSKSQFYLMFLAIEAHFVRKVDAAHFEVTILLLYLQYLQFFAIEPHFVRKGCAAEVVKSQFYSSFWRSNLISCEMVVSWTLQNRNFTSQFLAIEPHFVRKGCRRGCKIAIFHHSFWRSNLVSCERVAFRAVSLALPSALREK